MIERAGVCGKRNIEAERGGEMENRPLIAIEGMTVEERSEQAVQAHIGSDRAVELGRSVARSANTGISMLIDPYGRVKQETPLFEPAVVVGVVDASLEPTRFLEWGDWVTMLCLALSAILVAVAWFRPIQRLDASIDRGGWG